MGHGESYPLDAVLGLLVAVSSLVKPGLWGSGFSSSSSRALERRLSSCGTGVSLLRGMWSLPGPGVEPMFSSSAGGFFTTEPSGKSSMVYYIDSFFPLDQHCIPGINLT